MAAPFEGEWRGPFIFSEAGRAFLVLAGNYDDVAGVALYEATDDTLVNWRYHKLLYQKQRSELRFLECPNFFKVDGKWLLLTSPYQTILMDAAGSLLADVEDDALEIQALLEPGDSKVRLRLRRSADSSRSIDITYDGTVLDVVGTQIPLGFGFDEPLKLHVFLDKSLLEIFVNGGCIAVTRVIDAPVEDLGVELIAQDASVSVIALEAWQVQTIW